MASLHHIRWDLRLTTLIDLKVRGIVQDHVGVEGDCPVAFKYEVDFCNVTFLFKDVTVICGRVVNSGHKAECELVDEITFTFLVVLKKGTEPFSFYDVFEQKA